MTRYIVRPMRYEDIEAVSEVERECFTTPWPTSAYRRELRDNRMGRYIVLTEVQDNGLTDIDPSDDTSAEANGGGVRRAVGQFLRPFSRSAIPMVTRNKERVVGFAGMWLMLDEAHVTTIGVKRELRGLGLGELLFATLLEIAMEMGARRVTLEVRVTNYSAQALYRKYSFREEGIRKRYYSDNNEDALIMWSERLESAEFQSRYGGMRSALEERLSGIAEVRT
ncbi:MAG TPA: ribosomal protein S18-alanine N-acetyltransferase [Chloroflexota bacterium]|nr:ribosomal protein S18-alanine N-acetyltransferase [Chloroflexota bacterium]